MASGVRFHIKALVFDWLGGLTDPTREEWRLVESLIDDGDDPASDQAWGLLYREPWFAIADHEGAVESRLRSDDDAVVDRMVAVLRAAQQWNPGRVADLVGPYVGHSEAWNRRLVALAQWSDLASDRRFFDLVLRLIDEGVLDDARGAIASNSDFWDVGYGLEEKAEWAVEYIQRYLLRHLRIAEEGGVTNPFDRSDGTIPDTHHNQDFFLQAAEGAPLAYVDRLLPIFVRIIEATAQPSDERLTGDLVWAYRYRDDRYGIDAALLTGMEQALQALAKSEPETFVYIADQLGDTGFDTTNFLAIRGFLGNPEVLAEAATDYLLQDPRRLRAGYMDEDHWSTRELLAAIFKHLGADRRNQIERLLLSYYTPWEKSHKGYTAHGHEQFVLLSGLPTDQMSEQAVGKLRELQRKFRREQPSTPPGIIGGFVGPPIPQAAIEKMNNVQWLRAIGRYQDREGEWRSVDEGLRGGAEELAHALEEQAKKQPKRFVELAERIPDTANVAYFDAILRAVTAAEEDLDEEFVGRICRRCHALPGRPCGRWITDPIGRIAERAAVPDDLIELVIWYATEDPHPEAESWQEIPEGATSPYYGGDPYTAGINSVRGSAAETLALLIYNERIEVGRVLPSLERLVGDPSVAVRSCAAQTLLALLRHDRDLATRLFLSLVEADDALLATPHVERFILYSAQTHYRHLERLPRRMITSPIQGVRQVGGRQAVMAFISVEEAETLANEAAANEDAAVRRGAAQVAAANIAHADAGPRLRPLLVRLFHDADGGVRAEAARCFFDVKGLAASEYEDLLDAFVHSPAFADGARDLFYALDEAADPPVGPTVKACERFARLLIDESDPFSARGLDAERAAQLLLRVYQATTDEELRARCLDTIDQLSRLRTYGLDKALTAFERYRNASDFGLALALGSSGYLPQCVGRGVRPAGPKSRSNRSSRSKSPIVSHARFLLPTVT